MGAEFHRVVMAAMAAGLLVIPGCGAGAGGTGTGDGQGSTTTPAATQPRIVSATLDGTNSLKLTFSEAMVPAQNVDPAKFRLTMGYFARTAANAANKYSYKYSYKYTYKGSDAYYAGNYTGSSYNGYTRYYTNVAPVSGILAEPTASKEAVLLLGSSFDVSQTCQQLAAHKSSGLYLHYSSAGSPTIEDQSGNVLPSVADFWNAPPGKHPVASASGPIPVSLHCN